MLSNDEKFNFNTSSLDFQQEIKDQSNEEIDLSLLEECLKELEEENLNQVIKNKPELTEVTDHNEN